MMMFYDHYYATVPHLIGTTKMLNFKIDLKSSLVFMTMSLSVDHERWFHTHTLTHTHTQRAETHQTRF